MDNDKELLIKKVQQQLEETRREWMFQDQLRKISNFNALNKVDCQGGIVFAGDSITEGYPIHEMLPHKVPLFNRGISGITSSQLLEHIHSHILDLKPSKAFILVGTNDVAFHINEDKTAENIEQICRKIIEDSPVTKVFVLSIFPVNEAESYAVSVGVRSNKMIHDINHHIRQKVDAIQHVTYVNLLDVLSVNGQLNPEYTHDGLHLSIKGYQVVSETLKKYI